MDPQTRPSFPASPRSATLHDLKPSSAGFLSEVLHGLSSKPKAIPAKFFYDARGAELFELICELEEYYPTRSEIAIMRDYANEMAVAIGHDVSLIEFGSGSSRKTRVLLDALKPAAYVPIDISRQQLIESADAIAREYPDTDVHAVCADYSAGFELPAVASARALRRVVYFPGSTIGNFTPAQAREFLARTAKLVGHDGGLLIGVDLKKSPLLLHAAYNDAKGVTAAFNLNLLTRMNSELGADFDLEAFEHLAFYDEQLGRIEMHLRTHTSHVVSIAGHMFSLDAGETIHTEISCKYDVAEFSELASSAGWRAVNVWTDRATLFSVHYFVAA